MPASEYPQLDGMPEGCTENPPWIFTPITVNVPYMGVDEFVVVQEPLVPNEWPPAQNEMFRGDESYEVDVPGASIGYDTQEEHDAWNSFRHQASATKSNTAFYHPDAKEGIVALATRAQDLLLEIPVIYRKYEVEGSVLYPLVGDEEGYFPLSEDDDEVAKQLDLEKAGLWQVSREVDRDRIRDNFHEAIHLLWCALYGKNQSLSFRGNKQIYDESLPEPGLPEFQVGPSAPEPVPPEFPPFFPGEPPEPPPRPPIVFGDPDLPPGHEPGPPEPPPPEPDGYPGEDDDEVPPLPPPPSQRRRKAAGGGAGIVIALAAVAVLIAANK